MASSHSHKDKYIRNWHFAHNINRQPQPKKPKNSTSWGLTTFSCLQCKPLSIGEYASHGLGNGVD